MTFKAWFERLPYARVVGCAGMGRRNRKKRTVTRGQILFALVVVIIAPFMPRKEPEGVRQAEPLSVVETAPPTATPSLVRSPTRAVPRRATPRPTARAVAPVLPGTETAIVARIVDGDTIDLVVGAGRDTVRLIGIDTPEKRVNDRARRDAGRTGRDLETILAAGRAATGYIETLIGPGDAVRLEFDVRRRDKYGRLLAYVYLGDGRMINEVMLRAGFATVYTVPPNVRHVERLRGAERRAREEQRGLWGGSRR